MSYKKAMRQCDSLIDYLIRMERQTMTKTYISFKSGDVRLIDLETVRDQYGLVDLIDLFWRKSNVPVQATYINSDDTTGQIIFRLSDVESIEQMR